MLLTILTIDAAQIQNQNSQIPNYFVHPKCTNPKLFVHPKLFMAPQITYGIPNYLWHPKLLMASQIIYGIPNCLLHPKLFDISNYDTPNPKNFCSCFCNNSRTKWLV